MYQEVVPDIHRPKIIFKIIKKYYFIVLFRLQRSTPHPAVQSVNALTRRDDPGACAGFPLRPCASRRRKSEIFVNTAYNNGQINK